jgi:hypothetical protein
MAISFRAGTPTARVTHLPPGEYRATVRDAKEDTSTAGNTMIILSLKIQGHDVTVRENLVFTEKAFFKVDQFLKSCGKHPGEGEYIDIEPDDMIGWECKARLKTETYKDKFGNDRLGNKVESFIFNDEF